MGKTRRYILRKRLYSLNYRAQIYQEQLEALKDALRELPEHLVVTGDFNNRAIAWGMEQTNKVVR